MQDGEVVPVELKFSILRDEHKLLEGMLILGRDITERRKIEADQHLAAKVFENSMEGIYITGVDGNVQQINKAFTTITGFTEEQVLGKKPSNLGSGWHDKSYTNEILPALTKNKYWEGELLSRRSSGEAFLIWMSISTVTDARGGFLGSITSFRDITEEKSSEESIRKLAYYDPLTDLPNRQLFSDRLSQALQRANRNRHYISILFMDLDGFKQVNDDHGHAIGDRLLTEVALRLKACIRSDDTVARMGGDEFTIILNALDGREAAEKASTQIARKVLKKLNKPFLIQDKELFIGASIGIAHYPDDSNSAEDLIKYADTAMYHAKQAGKNGYQFYTDDMHQRAQQRLGVEQDIRQALTNDEFVLAFQPKLVTASQRTYGFEALLRWRHPEKGIIQPSGFMRALDELGLGSKMGEWVIEKACWQLKDWIDQGHKKCNISVNVFARHYRDGALVETVARVLKETAFSPELLTIEFSENLLMNDIGFAYAVLTDLKALGVRVAIDDFATGLLSLQYLNRLPVDEIKVDKQFIQHIDSDDEQMRLVSTMICIANHLGFEVVAEGVERQEQFDLLVEAKCPKVQGFLFSRPLFSDDAIAYLASRKKAGH